MKTRIPIAASAVLLVAGLSLTGCAPAANSGSSGSSGSNGSGGSSSQRGSTKNYSADDLVAILKATEAAQNLTGTIKTNAEIKADQQSLTKGESLTNSLTAAGGKITPASCGALLDNLVAKGAGVLTESSWTSASLDATNDIINVGSTTDPSGATGVLSQVKGVMDQVTSQCSSMKITAASYSIAFTIKPVTFTTNGDTTFGYEEDVTLPGTSTVDKTFNVEATYGNLFISDIALQKGSIASLESNVNAVIAAAKG